MAQQAYAYVTLVPVATGFQAGVAKELNGLGGVGQDAGNAISGGIGTGIKGLGPAIAGAFAIGAIKNFTSNLIDAGEAEQVSNNRLAAIAKSMGIFGNQTDTVVKRLQDYSSTQQLALGIDDDIIKSTQAKLLTFKDLASSADDAGGAFDRATMAAMDMAAAGFGDASNNAVQLGKALQDPIKGVTALARSGVTFTAQEKEKIKTLVESGNLLDAQNMVLKAVEMQVGGTAAATATASAKMDQAFAVVSESIGLLLLPAFESIATVISTTIVPAVQGFIKFLADNPWAQTLAVALTSVAVALSLVAIGYAIWNSAIIANTVALLANPITWIIIGVVALTAAIVYLATQTTFFQTVLTAMTTWVTTTWNAVVAFFKTTFTNIGTWFQTYIITPITKMWTAFSSFVDTSLKVMGGFFTTVFEAVGVGITGYINGWLGIFEGFINRVISGLNSIISLANAALSAIAAATGGAVNIKIPTAPKVTLPKVKLASGGFVDRPTTALIGEAGPEVVMPLNRFEKMMGLNGDGQGKQLNYYAAPNTSFDAEQELFQAMQRAKVVAGW